MHHPPRTILRYVLALILMIGGCALAVVMQGEGRSTQAVGISDLVEHQRHSDRGEKIRLSPSNCAPERVIAIKQASSPPLDPIAGSGVAARQDGPCRLLHAGGVATRLHVRPVERFSARAPPLV